MLLVSWTTMESSWGNNQESHRSRELNFPSLAENSLLGLTVHVGNYMKDYWEHTAQSIEDTS